jgi:hypothetical protein
MPPIDATYTAPSSLLEKQYGTGPKQLGGNPMSVLASIGGIYAEGQERGQSRSAHNQKSA